MPITLLWSLLNMLNFFICSSNQNKLHCCTRFIQTRIHLNVVFVLTLFKNINMKYHNFQLRFFIIHHWRSFKKIYPKYTLIFCHSFFTNIYLLKFSYFYFTTEGNYWTQIMSSVSCDNTDYSIILVYRKTATILYQC